MNLQRKAILKTIFHTIFAKRLEKCYLLSTEEHGLEFTLFEPWFRTSSIFTPQELSYKSFLLVVDSMQHIGNKELQILHLKTFIILKLISKKLRQRKFIWLHKMKNFQKYFLGIKNLTLFQIKLLYKQSTILYYTLIFDKLTNQLKPSLISEWRVINQRLW